MADRTHCTLRIYGAFSAADLQSAKDKFSDGEDWEQSDLYLIVDFSEVAYGEMDACDAARMVEALGCSYSWHVSGDHGIAEKVEYFDAETGERESFCTLDGEPAFTLGVIDKEPHLIEVAREWQEWEKAQTLTVTGTNADTGETVSVRPYTLRLAMSVRTYGSVTITADSPQAAAKALTPEYVAEHFQPHGGSDDIDYNNPLDIWVESATRPDPEEETHLGHNVPDTFPDPAMTLLTELANMQLDADGDVILGADEHGVNEWMDRIRAVVGGDV